MAKNTSGQYNGNLVIMTLIEAVNQFDGLLMGIGGSNNYFTFNADKSERAKFKEASLINKDQKEAAEEIVEDDQQLREKTAIRRAFFSTLLDTAAGAYYAKDILAGDAILTRTGKGMNEHDLASVRIEDYIRVLADVGAYGNNIIPTTIYLEENDNKFDNKTKPLFLKASMSEMIREGVLEQKTSDNLNVASSATSQSTSASPISNEEGESIVEGELITEEQLKYITDTYSVKNNIVNADGLISSPSLDNNTMVAFVIKENEFHFGNRRKEFLSLFFNGIPPIEMSRCTPYIELTFYHQNFAENKESYLNPAGYMNFYAEIDSDGKLKPAMFKSRPANEEYHSENLIQTDISYMDLFNSPQTMVNADINNTDKPNLFSNESKTSPYNHALEPFAPQATLNSLSITTTSGGYGFTSEKKGSLSMTIHDRSRLKQFASIIAVNHLAKSRVKITFGWSHPDADILSDNIFGRFLDSMKSTQMYTLTSSNMRFQGNSVEVDVSLVSMGNHHIDDMPAAAGEFVPLRVVNPAIVTIVEALVEKEKRKRGELDTGKIGMIHPQLDLLIKASNSMEAMVSANDFKELLAEIRENDIMGSDTLKSQDIIKKIAKILGITEISENDSFRVIVDKIEEATGESTTSSAAISKRVYDDLRKKSAAKLREKYESLFVLFDEPDGLLQPDYFTENCLVRNVNDDWKDFVGEKFFANEKYVSLGKLIANFIAAPMVATGEYSEVQLFFYPMNQACGGARCFTTASFPLSRDELDSIFEIEKDNNEKEATKKDNSIEQGTISAIGMFNRIASLLNSYDIDAYGLTNTSSTNQKKDYDTLIKSKKKDKNILTNFYAKTYSGDALDQKVKDFDTLGKEAKENEWKTAVNSYVKEQASAARTKELAEIYSKDIKGAPQDAETFRFPTLNLSFEVVQPIKPPSATETEFTDFLYAKNAYYEEKDTNAYLDGRILKIHITDESNVGDSRVDLASQILFDGSKNPANNEAIASIIKDGVNNLSDSELKEYIKRHYATLIYGSSNGVVKSINISSSTSDRIAQAKMMTYEKNRRSLNISKNVNTLADSVKIIPASIDLQMLGCPFIERGSQLFIDMGTNTDLDNCYTVNSVTHTLNKGDFTTSLGLVVSHQGTIANTRGNILQKLKKAIPK